MLGTNNFIYASIQQQVLGLFHNSAYRYLIKTVTLFNLPKNTLLKIKLYELAHKTKMVSPSKRWFEVGA